MTETPFVTVLIPARNEEADIERCLRAVLAQDHSHDRLEIVLVDGGSVDATVVIASRVLEAGCVTWRIVDNPRGTTPSNLNAGLAVASGEIVCRVDARSLIPPNYVRLCAEVLESRPDIAVTGGAQVAIANGSSPTEVGIARALNNRYVMGGARYRSGAGSGPCDTVYLGAFRSRDLREAGGWDEFFETNQDFELNRRMSRAGLVWFDGRLRVGYVPRTSIRSLWLQYVRFGRWKVRYWRRSGDAPRPRQLIRIIGSGFALIAVITMTLTKPLRPGRGSRAVVGAAVVGSAVALAVEESGTYGPAPADARARLFGVLALGAVGVGWLSGIASESLAQRSRGGYGRG